MGDRNEFYEKPEEAFEPIGPSIFFALPSLRGEAHILPCPTQDSSLPLIVADRSPRSVWIMDNRRLAEEIHALALSYGRADLYTASRVD